MNAKKLTLIISAILFSLFAISISSCDAAMPIQWAYDDAGHWRTVNGERVDYATHTLVDSIDATGTETMITHACTVCGYSKTESYTGDTAYVCSLIDNASTTSKTEYKTIADAITAYNNLNTAGDYTIAIKNGSYALVNAVIRQNYANKTLTVQPEGGGSVKLSYIADSTTPYILYISGESSNYGNANISIQNIDFDLTAKPSGTYNSAIEFGSDINERYAKNITIEGCTFVGKPEHNSFAIHSNNNSDPTNITVKDCTADSVACLYGGYGYGFLFQNVEITNSTSLVNSQRSVAGSITTSGIEFDKVTAVLSSSEDDFYGIRSNGGPIVIKNSEITMNYKSGATGGLILLRDRSTTDNAVHSITIENSKLAISPSNDSGYAIYNLPDESVKVENITVTIDTASTVTGGQNFVLSQPE